MHAQDDFIPAFVEVQELLHAARPDQLFEALRLLACEVAYCQCYHEVLPLPEWEARIQMSADPAALRMVTAGMVHLVEVLHRVHVTPTEAAGDAAEPHVVLV
jgi:hypothetical protein